MATTVEPIGSTGGPHARRSVSGSAPASPVGKNRLDYIKSMGWINRGFVFSVLGGLQIAVVIVGLINVSLLGAAMSHENPKATHYGVSGLSFHAFLFDVSFWCFMTSVVLLVTSATSVNTASSLPKTTFFIGYHAVAVLFYLIASITVLVEAAKYAAIYNPNNEDIKTLIYAGGSFGVIETILYVAITILGIAKFRQNRES